MEDLVALQKSSAYLRNPFGFTYVGTWDGKPISVPGDGKVLQVIKPLRDSLAKHLYHKVRNQYHDEQVQKLRDKGDDKGARKYRVPRPVENTIWRMITNENLYDDAGTPAFQQATADLTELKTELSKLDSQAKTYEGTVNVSDIVNQATQEALGGLETASNEFGESGHMGGGAQLNDEPVATDPVSAMIPEPGVDTAATVPQNTAAQQPQPSQPAPAQGESDFADLNQADVR